MFGKNFGGLQPPVSTVLYMQFLIVCILYKDYPCFLQIMPSSPSNPTLNHCFLKPYRLPAERRKVEVQMTRESRGNNY